MFWRLWPGNGLKWKFSLKTISRLTRKDKERERERAFDFVDLRTHEPIFDLEPLTHEPSTSPATQSLRATNRSSTQSLRLTSLRLHRQPRAFAPRTDLSLSMILIFCMILIDQWTNLRFCVILIFYFLSLISDFFVIVGVVWVVVFWWFSCCVVMGFVWMVVEKNIFRILPNTWKYFLKQFS